jgi:hypothetical protein
MKRDNLADVGLDGKVILNWVLKQSFGRAGTGLVRFRIK